MEVYAVVMALRNWRVYLFGTPFKVITDCKAFEDTMKKKTIPKLARWALELQQYDMQVIHRPSDKMKHVDALTAVFVIFKRIYNKKGFFKRFLCISNYDKSK